MMKIWTRFLCLLFLFCILGAKYTFAAEDDWETMQQMKQELEDLAGENSDEINSDEFNQLADSYLQMLIESKGKSDTGLLSEYVTDPAVTAEFVSGQFKFTLPNNQNFNASIPNGTMITAPVRFSPIENALVTVKKDGKIIKRPVSDIYNEKGSYEVKMIAYGDENISLEEFNVYEVKFCFRIIDTCTKDVNYIYPPEEYRIELIDPDGEGQPVFENGGFLLKDGNYEIRYESSVYPQQQYRFSFIRDTKPPQITFKNREAGNEFEAPAEFEISEPLSEFYVIHNGMRLEEPTYILKSEGSYHIVAVDQAGNQSEVRVKISKNYPFLGNLWIIVIFMFLMASICFILYFRRKSIKML